MTSAPPVVPKIFHRLAIAVDHGSGLVGWLEEVLGGYRVDSDFRQTRGIPLHQPRADGTVEESASGVSSEFVWIGDTPICLLSSASDDGHLAQYIARNGVGLHSLAWTVDDLWTADARLREAGLRIRGVDIVGRHFYLHPSDVAGLMFELTDTEFSHDPREHLDPARITRPAAEPAIDGAQFAWSTVVVDDVEDAVARLSAIVAVERPDLPVDPCDCCAVTDVRLGGTTIRLATALGPESPFVRAPDSPPQRLHSFCVSVPDLDHALTRLGARGVEVIRRAPATAWTNSRDTHGVALQWVERPTRTL